MCQQARILFLVAVTAATIVVPAAAAQPPPDLKPLLERIARSDGDDAADAADELIERIVGPLTEGLKGIEARPLQEQRRLLAALGRLTAVIKLRLYRGTLPPAEQKLFDAFAARNRELVESLFHDDPQRRLEALRQVPLEPGTAAGVLIVAKVEDWDAEVAEAALEAAASLKDDVVARGLTRSIAEAVTVIRSGQLGPVDQVAVAVVLGDRARQAARVAGDVGAKESVPVLLDALACFGRPPYRQRFVVADFLEALGKIGEERAAPALLEFLDDHEVQAVRAIGPGQLVQQTVGDAALLALARIYGVSPEKLGFFVEATPGGIIGFPNDQTRTAAVRAFGRWHKQNAGKPRGERAPLTTQPAEPPKDAETRP
jgi:hypothetical protein